MIERWSSSSSLIVASVIKTDVLLDNDHRALRDPLLHKWRRIEKLSQHDIDQQFWWMQDVRMLLKSDSISWRKTLQNSRKSQMQWFVVSTLCQETQKYLSRKVESEGKPKLDPCWSCNFVVCTVRSWDHNYIYKRILTPGSESLLEQIIYEFE